MDKSFPKGICTQMCPESEIRKRENEGLLHILELNPAIKDKKIADRFRTVKEFSRSAAGQNTQSIQSLRTFDTLVHTVNYLLCDVATTEHVKWNIIYDFIMDRMRSVRQDMVIQNFSSFQNVVLLYPIIKFYIYSAYRLCNQQISVFDPIINNNHLKECLKRILWSYDDLKENTDKEIYKKRTNMEALYLIVNLGSTEAMERTLKIPHCWKTDIVNMSLLISLEYWRGNYVRVLKMIPDLPELLLAAAAVKIPMIRKKALAIMSVAYNSKNLTYDAEKLKNLLLYDSKDELFEDCSYYNISVVKSDVLFSKSNFQDKPKLPSKHWKFVEDELLRYSIPQLLLQ